MRIFPFALAIVLVLQGSALAQKTHTVTSGQTLSHIAAKYGVSQSAILNANKLSSAHKLKIGQKLRIPSASSSKTVKKASPKSAASGSGGYTVRNGDHDWAISKKFGISVEQLHKLNPGVNWKSLQIGQTLRVPSKGSAVLASRKSTPAKVVARGSYTVQKGDNDWIIARRVGTTSTKLRAVNPGVKWTALKIGQKLRLPGSGASAAKLVSAPKISTRHAMISKDNVTIRRGPSTSSGKVTMVSAGTYVTVLDQESGWYKLKFPKGTVGWVRGDMLKPLAAQAVARASSRSRRSNYVAAKSPAKKVTAYAPATSLALLDTAYSMLGVRYRYGAASRSATDCSGFTTQVFARHGIKLPRTSREQSKVGTAVSKSNLKPGDLVFFRTRGSSRVSHVGIYVGNGKFIHSSSGKGHVRTDKLTEGYYATRYAGARRMSKKLAPGKMATAVAKLEKEEQDRVEADKIAAKGETQPAFAEPHEPVKGPTKEPTKAIQAPAVKPTQGTDEIIR
jgi:cell wall-associated NlpC family hydrolase